MEYTYKSLLADLETGRELDFTIKNTTYYIAQNEGEGYYFTSDDNTTDFDSYIDLVNKVRIEGYTLKQLFDNNVLEIKNLSIF